MGVFNRLQERDMHIVNTCTHTLMLNNVTVTKTYKCIDLVKGVVGEFGNIFIDVAKI